MLTSARFSGAVRRRLASWLCRRPFRLKSTKALITFTFDDFPRSALNQGGAILEEVGGRGTYFVALGLAGKTIATGNMFLPEDIPALTARGHELGCHTFDHCPAWETSPADYEGSVRQNQRCLTGFAGIPALTTHSYPISYPRPGTKRRLSRYFRACRAGGQSYNAGSVDLNHLNSFFIEQSVLDFDAIERVIATNVDQKGWLIFSTHDISHRPTRYGCTPEFFAKVVRSSCQSGAKIVVMSRALDELGVPPRPHP